MAMMLRVSDELYAEIKQIAKFEDRSIANMAKILLGQGINTYGNTGVSAGVSAVSPLDSSQSPPQSPHVPDTKVVKTEDWGA